MHMFCCIWKRELVNPPPGTYSQSVKFLKNVSWGFRARCTQRDLYESCLCFELTMRRSSAQHFKTLSPSGRRISSDFKVSVFYSNSAFPYTNLGSVIALRVVSICIFPNVFKSLFPGCFHNPAEREVWPLTWLGKLRPSREGALCFDVIGWCH